MRTSQRERMLTEWVVLALVDEGPTHGWSIVRALRPDGPIGRVWTSTGPLVYRAIGLLEQEGLLRPSGAAAGRGPSRTVLEATVEGSRAVRAWLDEPIAHVRDLRSELLVKLLLGERRGLDPLPLVRLQRERLRPVVRALRREARAAAAGDRLVPLWRATTAAAALRFLDAVERGQRGELPASTGEPGPAQPG
ncbi:MAG: PadR family transcriptional regulator [Chloroflexi bacterium]|nr:PadR family transcriptional regulator [Chloroflexota bacterium]